VRQLAAEFLKLRTTRTPWVLFGIAVLIGGLIAAGFAGFGGLDAENEDTPALALAQAASFFAILATVTGILLVTNEYRHGTVMTTFLAEPRRERVLGAKLVVALLTGAAFGLASMAVSTLVAAPWLAARGEPSLLGGELLEGSGRVVLSYALSAALGAAVGAILQNQVGAIITVFVWFLVVESIISVLSGLIFAEDLGERDPITPYLPGSALGGIVGGEGNEFLLRGGWAALLALGYVAGLSLVGALSMTRRDP
jgi:ABC-type transport system involved in multi-copper enzyme maturation permease subunit